MKSLLQNQQYVEMFFLSRSFWHFLNIINRIYETIKQEQQQTVLYIYKSCPWTFFTDRIKQIEKPFSLLDGKKTAKTDMILVKGVQR